MEIQNSSMFSGCFPPPPPTLGELALDWQCLRHYPHAQSQGHHTIDRLEDSGVEKAIHLFRTKPGAFVYQTDINLVSKGAVGEIP